MKPLKNEIRDELADRFGLKGSELTFLGGGREDSDGINAGEELKAKDYFKAISGSKLFEDTEEQRLRDAFRKKFGHEIDA